MIKSFFPENKEIRLPVSRDSLDVYISISGLTLAAANNGEVDVISSNSLKLLYKRLAANYFKFNIWDLKEELDSAIKTIKGKFNNFYFVKVLHENMAFGSLHFTL